MKKGILFSCAGAAVVATMLALSCGDNGNVGGDRKSVV